jgi:hypothetical protein
MNIDNNEDFEPVDDLGLENLRQTYLKFYTNHNVRRPSQAPQLFSQWGTLQLPNGSVLHSLNGFDTLVAPNDGLPDENIPLLHNEKNVIFLKLNTALSDEHSKPLGVDEGYTYRPNTLMPAISHFYQKHRKFHRILSDKTMGTMANALVWVDYSPLNEVKVMGTLHEYRKFDIIFRTILNTITKIGNGKHHFILIPQGSHVYPRALLQRSFKELSTSTLGGFKSDPSIYPLLHVLGYVFGKEGDLSVTPYKEDIRLLGKDSPLFEKLKSTSLLERIDPSLFESINFIFQKGNRAVVYNLADIDKFSEDTSFYTKLYRHFMNLRLSDSYVPDHIETDSDQFDQYVDAVSTHPEKDQIVDDSEYAVVSPVETPEVVKDDVVVTTNRPSILTRQITPVTKLEDAHDVGITIHPKDKTYEDKVRVASVAHTTPIISVEPKKETKRNDLIDQHFKVSFAGKSIGEHIQTIQPNNITPKQMDFVKSAPEASYKKSSLLSMDKAYQDHSYHHELAKVIGSVAKHGMYVTKIDEDHHNTEMDRTVTYKVGLSDLDGKAHNLKFTLPAVDESGLMKVSGVEYRLTRQIANIPICKISPTRVNLSSYYNKIIVERIQSKRYSFENDMFKLISRLKSEGLLKATSGNGTNPTKKVPYDYSAISRSFSEVEVCGYTFYFGGNGASITTANEDDQDKIPELADKFGIYVGRGLDGTLLFWDMANQIHGVDQHGNSVASWSSFTYLLADQLGAVAAPDKTSTEWTQAHILNQTIPLVFILGYELGLRALFNLIKLDYRFYEDKTSPELNIDDIAIRFKDGTLVFNRYPLSRSLIAGGLAWVSLKDFPFKDLNIPQTYGKVIAQKGMSLGVLKGLRGFIDFFVDPITETVLEKLHEPTTFKDLLLRANVMLTDYHSEESSSVKLHRFRLYERFNGIVYNEIYRALANHRNNTNTRKGFSINPEAVFQSIVQDATVAVNDAINPVHEVKQRTNFTFTGAGGRTTNSFVLRDRIYPKDGLGVVSDAVPDSGKVGITNYLSASPNIDDIHGLPKPYVTGDKLEPPQIMSIGSMLMPGGTTDDGKRNSYLSIQISHYVPNHVAGETAAVRTGYDEVLPHLVSDLFAVAAEDNGVVEHIDEKLRVLKVRYSDKDIPVIKSLKLNYLDAILDRYHNDGTDFGILIPDTEVGSYPMGGIFSVTRNTNVRVIDRLRCDAVASIPDKDAARKQNSLINEFNKGKYKSLYFIRFKPIGKKTPGILKSYSYADVYSPISGSHLLQKREITVKEKEHFKTGDILIYNSGFFVPDPMSKQVTFKHGVMANIALIEKGSNHEDACEMSRDLSERLAMTPCHQREVITKKDAAVLSIVKLGDHVETADSLCIISDEYLVGSSLNLTMDNLDLMEKLNRQTPTADYAGYIRKIRILYGCDRNELSDSLKELLKVYEKEVRQNFTALNTDPTIKPPERPGYVKPGTRYQGISFTDDTVIIEFMIEESINVSEGDKVCVSLSSKSIASYINEKQHFTESGVPIDLAFSSTGVINRIVSSFFSWGIVERNMQKLKENVLSMYFDEK